MSSLGFTTHDKDNIFSTVQVWHSRWFPSYLFPFAFTLAFVDILAIFGSVHCFSFWIEKLDCGGL